MYQIQTVDGKRIINGMSIASLGAGDKCEIRDNGSNTKFSGTYADCCQWLRDRALLAKVVADETCTRTDPEWDDDCGYDECVAERVYRA